VCARSEPQELNAPSPPDASRPVNRRFVGEFRSLRSASRINSGGPCHAEGAVENRAEIPLAPLGYNAGLSCKHGCSHSTDQRSPSPPIGGTARQTSGPAA